jgi:NAD(P)-dependent dehydrogenase (short-subunit alcohol dehydrogenase family)
MPDAAADARCSRHDRPMNDLDSGSTTTPACAVIVGAGGTLGGAVARKVLARGIPVVAIGRDAAKLDALAAEHPAARPCVADIADDASIATIAAAIDAPVRLAFMGAGLPVRGSADTVEPGAVAVAMNVKLGGLLRLLRAVGDGFAPDARIVALTGYLGEEPNGDELAPGIVNAALQNLMKQLSYRYGAKGTTVHAVSPGPVDSDRLRRIAATRAEEHGLTVDAFLDGFRAESPLHTLIQVEQVAWAVDLLLDPEAQALHGSTLALDGGRRRSIF